MCQYQKALDFKRIFDLLTRACDAHGAIPEHHLSRFWDPPVLEHLVQLHTKVRYPLSLTPPISHVHHAEG